LGEQQRRCHLSKHDWGDQASQADDWVFILSFSSL
jgi:hypothetical protein